jgi:hypothetical protein
MIIVIAITLGVFMGALMVGFWMGRHTLEKKVFIRSKAGGQPVFEEDPYADAMRDEKNEGSL